MAVTRVIGLLFLFQQLADVVKAFLWLPAVEGEEKVSKLRNLKRAETFGGYSLHLAKMCKLLHLCGQL
jgi:hypothetical protein